MSKSELGWRMWQEPFELLGIRFAPLHVPFERRMQTLMASLHAFYFFIYLWPVVSITLFIAFFCPFLMWVPILYYSWCYYDRHACENGGREWTPARRWRSFRYSADYFPIRLISSCELPATRNYLVGNHPHGILSHGAFSAFGTEALEVSKVFPNLEWRLFGLKMQFFVPGSREMLLWTGACAASKKGIEAVFRWMRPSPSIHLKLAMMITLCFDLLRKRPEGMAGVLVIGGAAEALNHSASEVRLVLRNRKGFVKVALTNGVSLVPSFSFGENYIFRQVDNPQGSLVRRFQEAFKRRFGFSPPLFSGRGYFNYNFGLVPFRRPINVVVGRPVIIEQKVEQPTQQLIDETHNKYIDALQQLYDEFNPIYGDPEVKLVID